MIRLLNLVFQSGLDLNVERQTCGFLRLSTQSTSNVWLQTAQVFAPHALRSGPAILNSAISGNSGNKAWPMSARQEGVSDGQEISATHPSHPVSYTHLRAHETDSYL